MTEKVTIRACWCPQGIGIMGGQGDLSFLPAQADDTDNERLIPELTSDVDLIYLPMENLLTRHFHFPLKQVRHLDASMLAQELADTAGIEPEDWWFTWRAEKTTNGIAGVVFGLPNTLKQAIQGDIRWHTAPALLVDGWERLNYWLTTEELSDVTAVIDADSEGVFFGVYQHGIWQGMRRLNGDMQDSETSKMIGQQMYWSLQSMGMPSEQVQVIGRMNAALSEVFNQSEHTLQITKEDNLSPRHSLNLMLPTPSKNASNLLNLRHSKWSVRRKSSISRVWYRASLLAAGVCFLWLSLTSIHNQQLEVQLATMNDEIVNAFHRGLPNQPVIIDALAQLKQAAGGDDIAKNGTLSVSRQLGAISKAFTKQSWEMQELSINKGGTLIAGKVNDLNTLNIIRDALTKETGSTVKVADTDLKGNEVAFRVRWQ